MQIHVTVSCLEYERSCIRTACQQIIHLLLPPIALPSSNVVFTDSTDGAGGGTEADVRYRSTQCVWLLTQPSVLIVSTWLPVWVMGVANVMIDIQWYTHGVSTSSPRCYVWRTSRGCTVYTYRIYLVYQQYHEISISHAVSASIVLDGVEEYTLYGEYVCIVYI